jgi:glycosyltransferase involved in cell wall biosynthesis
VGGIPELIDETTGYLVSSGNTEKSVKEAVQAIKELIADDQLRSMKGIAARKKYESSFTLDIMWKKYLSIYLALR